jgi:hypothetical protein
MILFLLSFERIQQFNYDIRIGHEIVFHLDCHMIRTKTCCPKDIFLKKEMFNIDIITERKVWA